MVSILRSEYNDFSHHGHLSHVTWKFIQKLTYNFNIKRQDYTGFHWIDEFGLSSLLGLSSPVFLLKQSPLQQGALCCVQSGFDISKDRDSINSLGSLLQCWIALRVKKVPWCSQISVHAFVPLVDTTEKCLSHSSLFSPLHVYSHG